MTDYLSPVELAELLDVPVGTVYQWSSRGGGPPGFRVGRHLRWRRADVERWVDRRIADHARRNEPPHL